MFRFVTKTMHAYIDYPVALGLIVMPFILGIGNSNPVAFWLSVATGIAALLLTFLTDHNTGVVRVVPYKLHLAVDFVVGLVFVLAPFLMGFTGLDFWYFTLLGLTVLAVVGLHKPEQAVLAAA
jgi:hypothetical protein